MATAARPRLVENNHVDVKKVGRVRAEGLDDGTFCPWNHICREKDGGGMHKCPKWDNCNFFLIFLIFLIFGFGSLGKKEDIQPS